MEMAVKTMNMVHRDLRSFNWLMPGRIFDNFMFISHLIKCPQTTFTATLFWPRFIALKLPHLHFEADSRP